MDYLFSTTDKGTSEDILCDITGTVPAWLQGSLYRVGPGQFHHGESTYHHWFDGIAFMHKYTINRGGVTYRSRKLEGELYKLNERAQLIVRDGFGHLGYPDPCRSLFDRYFTYFFGDLGVPYDNDNVNMILRGDQLYAITESGGMSLIDKTTLEKHGRVEDVESKFVAMHRHTAHPHMEKDGSIINLGTVYSGQSAYGLIRIPPPKKGCKEMFEKDDAKLVATVAARWPRSPSYFHSFGMSENYYILAEIPLSTNVLSLLFAKYIGASFLDNHKFHKQEKTLLVVVDKVTGQRLPITFYAPPFFTFHHVNAYEDDDMLIVDICCYDDASILQCLVLSQLRRRQQPNLPPCELQRFVLPLKISDSAKGGDSLVTSGPYKDQATLLQASAENPVVMCQPIRTGCLMELPRINYDYNTRKYRYVYGTSFFLEDDAKLKKHDMVTGETVTWRDEQYDVIGEPVFVASPQPNSEDDGIVMAPLLATREEQCSGLVILDAKTFTELARAYSPPHVKVPMTFHGDFDNVRLDATSS